MARARYESDRNDGDDDCQFEPLTASPLSVGSVSCVPLDLPVTLVITKMTDKIMKMTMLAVMMGLKPVSYTAGSGLVDNAMRRRHESRGQVNVL